MNKVYSTKCKILDVHSMSFDYSEISVVRLSRLVWDQEAAGSNPASPTTFDTRNDYGVVAQPGRALD